MLTSTNKQTNILCLKFPFVHKIMINKNIAILGTKGLMSLELASEIWPYGASLVVLVVVVVELYVHT